MDPKYSDVHLTFSPKSHIKSDNSSRFLIKNLPRFEGTYPVVLLWIEPPQDNIKYSSNNNKNNNNDEKTGNECTRNACDVVCSCGESKQTLIKCFGPLSAVQTNFSTGISTFICKFDAVRQTSAHTRNWATHRYSFSRKLHEICANFTYSPKHNKKAVTHCTRSFRFRTFGIL